MDIQAYILINSSILVYLIDSMANSFFKNFRLQIFLILLLGAVAWSTSITNEFVGYDDIKLIVRNERIHNDVLYAIVFYWNIVSDSHNVCWTNFPTVIYRPLEWVGSSIGYSLWGARSWCFHLFVNFTFHLLNGVLFFLILRRIFDYKAAPAAATKVQKKKFAMSDKPVLNTLSAWVPFVIIAIWIVHPLHNEAVNMLTSGVGFLWATLFCVTAFWLNLKISDLKSLRGILLLILSSAFFFIGYHGSEMVIIAPLMMLFLFVFNRINRNQNSYGYELAKVIFAFTSFIAYMVHRSSIVTEAGEWRSNGLSEFCERLFVVAPEILFHYIKLFFFPIKLSIDEHHQVVLANAFTPYHILCLACALLLVFAMFYFYFLPSSKFMVHNKVISGSLFFAALSIAMSLNIIPLYCLARDRYTYFFVLGLLIALIVFVDKVLLDLKDRNITVNSRILITLLILIITPLSLRSMIKSLDWHNGENFWSSTMDSVSDIGAKQNWRYRLLQYYEDPGTDTFKPNLKIQEQAVRDFLRFIPDNGLERQDTLQRFLDQAKDPRNYIKDKYGYSGNKTIASAIFFNAVAAAANNDIPRAINIYKLAHAYYPGHFQTNLQLFINVWKTEPEFGAQLLKIMEEQASKNSFLAKGLMDALFHIKHPETYAYSKLFVRNFSNTQVFHIYHFHGAYFAGDYDVAYAEAKEVIKKYHENTSFEEFIAHYEKGRALK